jgi:hypothetical protein
VFDLVWAKFIFFPYLLVAFPFFPCFVPLALPRASDRERKEKTDKTKGGCGIWFRIRVGKSRMGIRIGIKFKVRVMAARQDFSTFF